MTSINSSDNTIPPDHPEEDLLAGGSLGKKPLLPIVVRFFKALEVNRFSIPAFIKLYNKNKTGKRKLTQSIVYDWRDGKKTPKGDSRKLLDDCFKFLPIKVYDPADDVLTVETAIVTYDTALFKEVQAIGKKQKDLSEQIRNVQEVSNENAAVLQSLLAETKELKEQVKELVTAVKSLQ